MSAEPDARTRRIEDDLAATLAPMHLLVEELSVQAVGKRRVVRVLVDRALADGDAPTTQPVEPLSLDEIGEATRVVSDRLDETDAMGEQPYVLEVSSPGTDRPLTLPRHYRRNVGRLVELTLSDGRVATGRIRSADEHHVQVAVDAGRGKVTEQEFAQADITKARVQVEFNRPGGEDNR